VLAELRKVAWADRSETIHNAFLVLAVVVCIVVAIAILDLAFGAIGSLIG
jgi:preprotein translocase SecE subunit